MWIELKRLHREEDSIMNRKTLYALLIFGVAAMPGFALDPASGWAILNPRDDHEAQIINQKLILDMLDQGLTVCWVVKARPPIPGIRAGDYIIPRQEKEGYAIALLKELSTDRKKALSSIATVTAHKLSYPKIILDGLPWASFHGWYYDTLLKGGFRFEHPAHQR